MEGEACDDVLYVRMGGVTLSVRSKTGREAVAATLGPGDFFGEGCLAGESSRTRNATAITPSTILSVGKVKMARLLRTQPAMADRFIAHLLGRYARIEESLIDQLFDSSEPHVNVFLNEFRRLGFVEYKSRGPLRINSSLLGVILRD